MKSDSMRFVYKHNDGTIRKELLDDEGNVIQDPAQDTDHPPDINEQIQYLIEFIDYFKNNMDAQHITDFVQFMIASIVGGDAEKFNEILKAVETAKATEEAEAAQIAADNPEAVLSDLPHNGYAILKLELNKLKSLNPKERETQLERYRYRNPDFAYYQTSRVFRLLFGEIDKGMTDRARFDDEPIEIRVSNEKAKKLVTATIGTYIYVNDIMFPQYLNSFDKLVFNAICSLFEAGCYQFTCFNVYEVMNGKPSHSTKALTQIKESIERMMGTLLIFNAGNWLKMKKIFNVDLEEYRGALLPVEYWRFKQNGKIVEGYRFTNAIRLFQLSKIMNECFSIPIENLRLPVNRNENISNGCYYLLYRIATMKSTKNNMKSDKIKFSGIYDAFMCSDNKGRQQRVRDQVFTMLNYWSETPSLEDLQQIEKERPLEPWEKNRLQLLHPPEGYGYTPMQPTGWIKGYEIEQTTRRGFHAVKIIL